FLCSSRRRHTTATRDWSSDVCSSDLVVSTRVLSPRQAVVWAAFFNFVAAWVFHLKVAKTVGKGIIDPHIVDTPLIIAALTGAIRSEERRVGKYRRHPAPQRRSGPQSP